jgi:exosortase
LLWLAPLLFLWQGLIRNLSIEWSLNPQYRYGWGVPFLCAYLFWRRWPRGQEADELKPNLEKTPGSKSGLSPLEWPSLPQTAYAMVSFVLALAYAPTRLIQEANPEWRLVSWALAIEVIGLTVVGLRFFLQFRHGSGFPLSGFPLFAFPFLFFLLSVPWPTVIEGPLIRSLTGATAQGTAEILGLLGIPAVLHGNVIETSAGLVGIDDACCGIRSFQASLMITLFFGQVYLLSLLSRILCVIGGLLVALGFNLIRTTLLALIVATKGSNALDAWHDSAGLIILLCCFAATWLLAFCLGKIKKPIQPVPKSEHLIPVSSQPVNALRRTPFWRMSLALACWIAFVELGTQMWYRAHEQALPNPIRWCIELPHDPPGLRDLGLSQTSRQFLRFDDGLNATWQDPAGLRWQALFLRWDPGRVAARLARNHTPEDCLIASGHNLVPDPILHVIPVQGLNLPFRFYFATGQAAPFHVFYCLWEDRAPQQPFAAEWLTYRNRLMPVLAGRRNSGQRSLELALWGAENDQVAEIALKSLLPTILKIEH